MMTERERKQKKKKTHEKRIEWNQNKKKLYEN